jgi:glutamate-1-semialdehyde aminotransferase
LHTFNSNILQGRHGDPDELLDVTAGSEEMVLLSHASKALQLQDSTEAELLEGYLLQHFNRKLVPVSVCTMSAPLSVVTRRCKVGPLRTTTPSQSEMMALVFIHLSQKIILHKYYSFIVTC